VEKRAYLLLRDRKQPQEGLDSAHIRSTTFLTVNNR
jgi:hypothetical protein